MVGDGGSVTVSSARSTARASSADRNQEQLPRLGQGECLSGSWCVPAKGHGVQGVRRVGGLGRVCPTVAELNDRGVFWGLVWDQL